MIGGTASIINTLHKDYMKLVDYELFFELYKDQKTED